MGIGRARSYGKLKQEKDQVVLSHLTVQAGTMHQAATPAVLIGHSSSLKSLKVGYTFQTSALPLKQTVIRH